MPAGRKIIDEVCKARRISENDLLSRRRTDEYVRVRHEICYRLKRETSLSLPQIGRMLNRDHTSVIHGIRKWEAMLAATAKATDEA
jgi:chromosomal replication initiation ATPase DnaA